MKPETRQSFCDDYTFQMNNLKVHIPSKEFDVDYYAANILEDDSDKIMATRFGFPYQIERAVLHTFFVSPDKRKWFHFWVYKNMADENPIGQISMVFNYSPEQGEETSCAAKEVYF